MPLPGTRVARFAGVLGGMRVRLTGIGAALLIAGCATVGTTGGVRTQGTEVALGRVYTDGAPARAEVREAAREASERFGPSWDDYVRLQEALLAEQERLREAQAQLAEARSLIEVLRERVAAAESGVLSGGRRYEVRKGDSLWDIAARELGDPYKWIEIYHSNLQKIQDPDLIYPGQVLLIPEG